MSSRCSATRTWTSCVGPANRARPFSAARALPIAALVGALPVCRNKPSASQSEKAWRAVGRESPARRLSQPIYDRAMAKGRHREDLVALFGVKGDEHRDLRAWHAWLLSQGDDGEDALAAVDELAERGLPKQGILQMLM